MFRSLNAQYNAGKIARRENKFILESVLGVNEILPGSEEELEDVTDVDSVPEDAYKKVDAMLDKIVSDPNYDDTEAEEMLDGEDDMGDIDVSDEELNAVIDEAADCMVIATNKCAFEDDENMGHPDKERHEEKIHQDPFQDTHDDNDI